VGTTTLFFYLSTVSTGLNLNSSYIGANIFGAAFLIPGYVFLKAQKELYMIHSQIRRRRVNRVDQENDDDSQQKLLLEGETNAVE
jgi:hypothetical protein